MKANLRKVAEVVFNRRLWGWIGFLLLAGHIIYALAHSQPMWTVESVSEMQEAWMMNGIIIGWWVMSAVVFYQMVVDEKFSFTPHGFALICLAVLAEVILTEAPLTQINLLDLRMCAFGSSMIILGIILLADGIYLFRQRKQIAERLVRDRIIKLH